jgi:hypothetical protein
VIGQVVLGWAGRNVALRGDRVTALTWAITERPRGVKITNAAMVWTLLRIAADVNVKEVTHIVVTANLNCDRLSRRKFDAVLSVADEASEMGVTGAAVVEVNGDENIMAILQSCDLRAELRTELDFIDFWTRARSAIDIFLSLHKHAPTSTNSPPPTEGQY